MVEATLGQGGSISHVLLVHQVKMLSTRRLYSTTVQVDLMHLMEMQKPEKTYSTLIGVSAGLSASLRGSMSFVGPRTLRFLDFLYPLPAACASCMKSIMQSLNKNNICGNLILVIQINFIDNHEEFRILRK